MIEKPCSVCGKPIERDPEYECLDIPPEAWICSPECWATLIPDGCLKILDRRTEEITYFVNESYADVLDESGHGAKLKVYLACEGPDGRIFKLPTSFERLQQEKWAFKQLKNLIGS